MFVFNRDDGFNIAAISSCAAKYSIIAKMKENAIIASIIVLNYNGEKTLPDLIESLEKLTFPRAKWEVLIVDNASTDRSGEYLRKIEKRENWQVVWSETNLGFAGGNNLAIKKARGRYVILLNNDCLVASDWLTELVNCANNNPETFSINSKIVLDEGKNKSPYEKIQNIGSLVFQDGYSRDIGASIKNQQQFFEEDCGQFDQVSQVYTTCGAAVLYNKRILSEIARSGLDETFFMYYEDTALSEKARILGYTNITCPRAKVYHHHAQSSGEWSPFFIFHVEKGRLLHMYYNFPYAIWLNEWHKFFVKTLAKIARDLFKTGRCRQGTIADWQVISDWLINCGKYRQNKKQNYSSYENWSILVKKNYQEILSGKWYFN